jgi:hypothetical protein
MTTEPGGEAAVVETTPQAAPEAALSSQEQGDTRDWEAEAAAFGWVPKDQFKGDPERWRPAEEFVRRGEEILPIVRKQNEKLNAKVSELEETNKRMSAMFEKTTARIKAEYAGKIEALKAEKKVAIKAGDADKVERIEAEIDTLKEAVVDGPEPTLEGGKKDVNALIKDFATANSWFVEEPDMQEYAVKVSESNAALNEGISFEDNMKFVLGAVRKKFPGYFKEEATTAANGHAAVDGGGSFPGAQQAKGPASKLNQTELAQARKDVAAKLYANVDEWAKVYLNS